LIQKNPQNTSMNKDLLIEREVLANKTKNNPKRLQGDLKLLKDKGLIPKESNKKQKEQKIKCRVRRNMIRMIRNMREGATIALPHPHLLEIITEDVMNQNAATKIIAIQISPPTIIEIGAIVEIVMTRTTTRDTMTGDTERKEITDTSTSDQETISEETIPHPIPRIPTTTNTVIAILRSQTRRKKQLAVRTITATVQSKKENEASD
jgi:hypothetical protein